MKLSVNRSYEQIKIYINGHLHLLLRLEGFIGMQSWVHGNKEYFIEYSYKDGAEILTAYEDKDTWEKALDIIDKNITHKQ